MPTSFTLNGVACTGSTNPTTGPTTTGPTTTRPPGSTPPEKTVRVYWLKPTDVAYDQRYPDGIANVIREAKRYYRQELGRTFTLNECY